MATKKGKGRGHTSINWRALLMAASCLIWFMIWVLGSEETGKVDEESMVNVCETVRT